VQEESLKSVRIRVYEGGLIFEAHYHVRSVFVLLDERRHLSDYGVEFFHTLRLGEVFLGAMCQALIEIFSVSGSTPNYLVNVVVPAVVVKCFQDFCSGWSGMQTNSA
jgi:hypothetical protein